MPRIQPPRSAMYSLMSRFSSRTPASIPYLLPSSPDHLLHIKGSSSAPSSSPSAGRALRLVFLGGPGVGKGTYGSMLSKHLGVPHISTGDLIRAELSSRRPPSTSSMVANSLKEMAKTLLNQGKLLPDDIVMELLSHCLRRFVAQSSTSASSSSPGFILDGFPRTLNQARALDEALQDLGPIDMAINLHMEEEALVAKCLGRRVCAHCGKDYNLSHLDIREGNRRIFLPARLPHPGSPCEAALSIRDDDIDEGVVRERLRLHFRETQGVEEHYRRQGKVSDVDVGRGMEHTWALLLKKVMGLQTTAIAAMTLQHPRREDVKESRRMTTAC